MVTQDGDHRFDGGEKQAGLRPLPRPQLQGSSSPELGRRAGQVGACLRMGWRPASSSGIRGGNHPPGLRRRRPPAMRGKANCCCPARVQHSVLHPGDCGWLHRGVAQHVVRREGGTHVLGRSHSHSCGEDGSEDLPVRFGAVATRGRGVGRRVAAVVGAEVVVAGEGFSAVDTVIVTCALGLWLFGFNGRFSSPVRGHEREPSSGSVRPGAITAAVLPSKTEVVVAAGAEVAGEPPGVCRPAGFRCGGCSYPREWNRSSVCNGTLSVGVCSLWLSGPEHLCIWA
jgi:hypothetical protein